MTSSSVDRKISEDLDNGVKIDDNDDDDDDDDWCDSSAVKGIIAPLSSK